MVVAVFVQILRLNVYAKIIMENIVSIESIIVKLILVYMGEDAITWEVREKIF